jgi:hypothetical protein
LIVLVGAMVVFGGYFVWMGFLDFLDDQGDITAQSTRDISASATARAAPPPVFSSPYLPASFTPLPPCEWYTVRVDRAVYRECPSQDNTQCPILNTVEYGTEFCVYSRVPNNPEWFIVELNPNGSYRNTVFMHESVLEPVNPTRTPAPTVTPGPTLTLLPSSTPAPTLPPSPTPEPTQPPDVSPRSTPTPTPPPTVPYISI